MAQLTQAQAVALGEAIERRSRNESLEQAVGRAMRRAGLGYDEYIVVMDAVRHKARRKGMDLMEAARLLIER